ncbi:congested-like trachea protein isoform X1 [Rhizophagus irregularis DAOM 181602=DAOM 197198]|nr:congested-like trachea protein isoform X1 [Rhizophagus irregularis DAOM 181602=DAOM 197198]
MQKDFIESIGKEVSKGTVRRTRLPKESLAVNCLVPTIKHGRGGIGVLVGMIWPSARQRANTYKFNDTAQLPWPRQSPDLNPIEHMWDELERRIRARTNSPKNLGEIESFIQECWSQIQCEMYQKLVESMNR